MKLMLGGMGGELETDLPFKLVHPHPDSEESLRLDSEKKNARAKVIQPYLLLYPFYSLRQRGRSSKTRIPSSAKSLRAGCVRMLSIMY